MSELLNCAAGGHCEGCDECKKPGIKMLWLYRAGVCRGGTAGHQQLEQHVGQWTDNHS